jgi:hypothetical protein
VDFALNDFLEIKGVVGYGGASAGDAPHLPVPPG